MPYEATAGSRLGELRRADAYRADEMIGRRITRFSQPELAEALERELRDFNGPAEAPPRASGLPAGVQRLR